MHNRKFFIVFKESRDLKIIIAKNYTVVLKNIPTILTREPGGTIGAERIRKIILEDYFHGNTSEKFCMYTDTLLYLAARNEHIQNKIKNAVSKDSCNGK